MVLKKRQIPLNIMESTDQITADKISMKPSNIENVRFDKNAEVTKRFGITTMGTDSPTVVSTIGESGYVGNSGGFYGVDFFRDKTTDISDTPILPIGVIKRKVFGTSAEIRSIAHARGENYHFVAFHERHNVSVRSETKVFLLDDDFEVVKDISQEGNYLDDDFESVQIVSYEKNGETWVTIIRQTTTSGGVTATHFDGNGDYDSQDSLFATKNTATIAAVSTGTGYYIGSIDSSNNFKLTLYDGSSHTTVTDSSGAFTGYGVGSITYFSDYVISILNPYDPSSATYPAILLSIPLSTWPTSITVTTRSLIIGGYSPKWGTVTKVDDTYYVLAFTDYDAATDMHRAIINKPTKTTTSPAGVTGVITERCCTIGHVFINVGRADALLMTPNGYNPIYHLIRQDLTNDYYETISSFLSGQAPISEFYANGLPGQNPVEGQDQFLFRSQPTFSTTIGKLYTMVPIQPLGNEFASWQALEFDFHSPVKSLEAYGVSAISSGCFGTWDGVRYIRGVTAYPEIISSSATGSTYNYQYIPVYKTVDGNGNVVRSLVGPVFEAKTGSVISVANPVSVTYAKKALLFNDYPSSSNGVEQGVYELYRTEHNGVIFYKAGESLYSGGYIIQDNTADADLINNELLYTTGGVLENSYPETCNGICYSNDRLWTIGDGDLVHYSKEYVSGNAIEFNDGLVYKVGGTRNVAIARLGKRQVVFKKRSCNLMYGNPASNIGTGQNLTHQEISSSVGCANPQSVVEIDSGIIFESLKGIYMISGNGALSFIGKDVLDYTRDNTSTNAAHIKDKNEVHFAFESGIVLVYNYLFGIWSHDTFNIPRKPDQVFEIAGKAYYDAGGLYRSKDESDSFPYSDTQGLTDDYAVKYSTGWMKFASVGGFQRVYRFFVLGSKTTEQDLILNVYNDYDDSTPSQTKTFTLSASDPLEFELHVARQKCESIKFEIVEDIATVSNTDLKINALVLQVGVKRGYNKLSPDLRQ